LTGKNLIAALREALSNAFRHAGASRIEVVVDVNVELPDGRPAVRLSVADDGVGIPEGDAPEALVTDKRPRHSVLSQRHNGRCRGRSGGGTTVVWQVPH
ncbi:ATP-binding protein, partial [Streptomyces sp. NPDC127574]|uniref:ATP-binding protein n=1 Tax=Streptomyces sp. NPDC127574 TaxID=3345401 RepID=UPI0036362E3B